MANCWLCRKGRWSQKKASEEFNVPKSVVSRFLRKEGETDAVSQKKAVYCTRKTGQYGDELCLLTCMNINSPLALMVVITCMRLKGSMPCPIL